MKRWLLIIVVLAAAWYWWPYSQIAHAPGVVAAAAPLQTALEDAAPRLSKPGYQIQALARFELDARVLGVEHYRFDRGADLAPVDLALGWGRMSDTAVLDRITISQGARFYHWSTPQYPIPRREIETSSANMHLVPANEEVARQLSAVRPGNMVRLSGYLIEARGADGWRWRSSLTRNDTGNGACELIWVERLSLR
jgi:hypothetical protein